MKGALCKHLKDFGGHITHTPCLACHPVCPLDLDQVRNLAQPEVPDLDMPILIQQEIRGFEVSVYDDGRAVVEETQCPGKLHTPPKHLKGRMSARALRFAKRALSFAPRHA